jgi:hypothetical protein
VRYQPGRPGTFVAIDELAGYELLTMYEDRSGTLWIGTETKTWATNDGETHHGRGLPQQARINPAQGS